MVIIDYHSEVTSHDYFSCMKSMMQWLFVQQPVKLNYVEQEKDNTVPLFLIAAQWIPCANG